MKIFRIDLIAFGPFTNKSLDFSGGREGLHILYGPNEAGKSSALRALTALFYGIPSTTGDNFLHDNKDLRLGAHIRNSANDALIFYRRKGNKNTLLDETESALPDSALQRFTGGMSEEIFTKMFGMDHRSLVVGGHQMAIGGGKIGESLFAASTGISNLNEVLNDLNAEVESLFKPAGQNPLINRLIREYNEARKNASEYALSGKEWETHYQALQEARTEQERIKADLEKLRKQFSHLQRMNEALPIIKERQDRLLQTEALKEVILLPPSFPADRQRAKETLDDARRKEKRSSEELMGLEEEMNTLSIPEKLLLQAEMIIKIHESLGSHLKAQSDLPRLQGEWEQLQTDIKAILSDLRPDLTAENAGLLRITVQTRIHIEGLGKKIDASWEELNRANKLIQEINSELAEAKKELEKLDAPRDTKELQGAVNRGQKKVVLEDELKAIQAGLKKKQRQADIDCKALPFWNSPLEALETSPVPPAETIERFEGRFNTIDTRLQTLSGRIKEEEEKGDSLEGKIKAIEIEGAVPAEQELIDARKRRDDGWALILRHWLKGEDVGESARNFNPALPLHEAYKEAVKKADELADRLRREADRVAEMATLKISKGQCLMNREKFREEYTAARDEHLMIQKEWEGLWQGIGITALSPKEMRAWLKQKEALAAKYKEIREDSDRIKEMEGTIAGHKTMLCESLQCLGATESAPFDSLSSLIDKGTALIEKIDKQNRKRETLEKEITSLERKLSKAMRDKEETEEALKALSISWREALAGAGMDAGTTPSQANAVIARTQELFSKIDEAEKLQKRIQGIQRDAQQFEEDVRGMVELVAPDILNLPSDRSAAELNSMLSKGREDDARLKQLKKRYSEKKEQLHEAQNTILEMETRIKNMCQQAACSAYEELEGLENRSSQKGTLLEQIKVTEEKLSHIAHTGGMTEDELIKEAVNYDIDLLPAQIKEIEQEINSLDNKKSDIDQKIGSEEKELEKMDGGAQAAEAAEEMQGILARMRENTERYSQLWTASLILKREIERYRQKNQGPILERANTLFSELTLGSFSGLKAAYDELDKPILVGVRPQGAEVRVSGMSDGTSDQLYLALRLASLQMHIESAEPIPFIIDDILINFDDERAKATLRALADLSQKTQIIFFTHHSHLLDLARKVIPDQTGNDQILYIHDL